MLRQRLQNASGGILGRSKRTTAIRPAAYSPTSHHRLHSSIHDGEDDGSNSSKADLPREAWSKSLQLARRTAAPRLAHDKTLYALKGATFNKWGGADDFFSGRHATAFPFSSSATATWAHMPRNEQKLQKMAKQSLLHELWQEQQRTHGIAVDWFLENMPASYFRQTTEEARLQHLGAIAAMLEEQPQNPEDETSEESSPQFSPTRDVTLHFERSFQARKEVTFVQPRFKNRDNGILGLLDSLPLPDGSLQRVHVFPSRDGNLAINVFAYVQQPDAPNDGLGQATDSIPPTDTQAKKARREAAVAAVVEASAEDSGGQRGELATRGPMTEAVVSSSELLEYAASIQAGEWIGDASHPPPDPMFEPDAMLEYISRCEPEFVQHSHPRRFCKHRMLYEEAAKIEGIATDVEAYQGSEAGATELRGSYWISIAAASVLPKVALGQCLRLLASYNLETIRCHLDVVDYPGNGSVTIMRLLVNDKATASATQDASSYEESEDDGCEASDKWDQAGAWEPVMNDLRRLKWLDNRVYELALDKHPGLGFERSEVIVALANMVYGTLNKRNPWAYSKSQISQWLDNPRYVKHAAATADLFCALFDPDAPLERAKAETMARDIRAAVKRDVEYDVVQGLLNKMIDAVLATYRTNFFMPNRWALSLRVDPRVLMTSEELKVHSGLEVPFGVFFVSGRRFSGFHCRFRDIARGGMRIVTPQTLEQVAIESGRQFDECYALAYAQQLKNKDIPEGGSKAVVLVDTTNSTGRAKDYAVRKSVKTFSDALLDLVVDTEETRRYVVDLWGKQELLYLGPDEQVIPKDINWIVNRATQRGAPFPLAFMSSKPDAGINHKEYGVTSEGVFVFLDEALRDAGINPKSGQKFTVKLTGGPDGDVAGNMIKILNREYGDACLIVGVADGTGSAEDPEGLSHQELLRLFEEGLPISEYRFKKPTAEGVLYTCDNEEGIRARNTMHNRVKADAFVPAGGRPGTINETNWSSFLDDDGKPSSPLVVEGANLFTTPEARDLLFKEAGVVFVKDSSANKCGVICSSFEIVSSMLMSSEEFTDSKDEIVSQVLDRLRIVGRREAELLFREHRNHPTTPLPRISERISHAINSVTDAALEILDEASAREEQEEHLRLLLPLFREHLPEKVVAVAFDRVLTTLPPQYLRNAMATCLACKVVYTEGINFIDAQPRDCLGELAFDYIREDATIRSLAGVVEGSADRAMTEEEKKRVVQILRSAGVRASLGVY